jgi:hypothetical protein
MRRSLQNSDAYSHKFPNPLLRDLVGSPDCRIPDKERPGLLNSLNKNHMRLGKGCLQDRPICPPSASPCAAATACSAVAYTWVPQVAVAAYRARQGPCIGRCSQLRYQFCLGNCTSAQDLTRSRYAGVRRLCATAPPSATLTASATHGPPPLRALPTEAADLSAPTALAALTAPEAVLAAIHT